MVPLETARYAILAAALVASVVTDVRQRRIPDLITLPAIGGALALRAWQHGFGGFDTGFISGVVGVLGAGAPFALLAKFGKRFGWGDVKLMAATGATLGYPLILTGLIYISLIGAVQALVALVWQGASWKKGRIPYAVAILLGSFWVMSGVVLKGMRGV